MTAVQAFRNKACRVGFLLGFFGGCLGAVACFAPDSDGEMRVRLADDASREPGAARPFDARAR